MHVACVSLQIIKIMNTHLKGIGVENFRVFNDAQFFNFAPITILTGTNSSGKSSLINLLTLLKESYSNFNTNYFGKDIREVGNQDLFEFFPPLSEEFIFKTFGNFSHITNNKNDSKDLSFTTLKVNLPGYEDSISLSIKYNFKIGPVSSHLDSIQIFISVVKETEIISFYRNFLKEYNLTEYNDLNNLKIFQLELGEHDEPDPDSVPFHTAEAQYDILFLLYISYRLFYSNITEEISSLETELNRKVTKVILKKIEVFLENKKLSYVIRRIQIEDEVKLGIAIYSDNYDGFEKRPITWFTDENGFSDPSKYMYNEERGKYHIDSKIELSFIYEWCKYDKKKISSINTLLKKFYNNEDEFNCHLNFQIDLFKLLPTFESVTNISRYLPYIIRNKEKILNAIIAKGIKLKGDIEKLIFPVIEIILENNQRINVKGLHSANTILEDSIPENAFFNKMIRDTYAEIFEHLINFKKIQIITNKRAFDDRQYHIKNRKELYLLQQLNKEKNKTHLNNIIKRYVSDFEIAEDIKFDIDEDLMMCKVLLLTKGKWVNIKDEGFGISKLIPLILSIQPEYDRDAGYAPVIILIEEPESNLHPALQSKLAELFVDLSKRFNIQFIIETHSEYLIRKLQYLTAKKLIKPEDTQLYYFHHPDRIPGGEDQIYPINIKSDGSLTKDFGKGFFDEADNIALELFLLKAYQNN